MPNDVDFELSPDPKSMRCILRVLALKSIFLENQLAVLTANMNQTRFEVWYEEALNLSIKDGSNCLMPASDFRTWASTYTYQLLFLGVN
jgi:hypothetical protein